MTRRGKATRGRRHQPKKSVAAVDPTKRKSKRLITWGLGIVTIGALVGSIVTTHIGGRGGDLSLDATTLDDNQPRVLPAVSKTTVNTEFDLEPKTLNELLNLPEAELDRVDLARVNLLCASSLPDTEGLDIEHALATLDKWAEKVAFETDRHLYRVHDPRPIYRDRYNGSEAHFRAEFLAQVLQEDLGVKYNLAVKDDFSFADSTVAFLHGMIPGPDQTTADMPGGTCTSMPVLYVAVGQRLGYPLNLVVTKGHVFARWDGEALYGVEGGHNNPAWRETFNCETTNGFHKYDDEHYKTWPFPVTSQEIAVNGLFESLNASEALAQFLGSRGHYAVDNGGHGFASRCFENAHRYDTDRRCYRIWFQEAALMSNYEPVTPRLKQELAIKRAHLKHNRRQEAITQQARDATEVRRWALQASMIRTPRWPERLTGSTPRTGDSISSSMAYTRP